ncbi:MAG: hypothetical protein U9R08_00830, partial [Nanoarchaeota archaeon]|nr:hypothetical protein [Nanoarchaeota archaeon]
IVNYPTSDLSTSGHTFKLFKGSIVAFKVNGDKHSVYVKDLRGDVVTLRFKSEEVLVDVKEGETERVDLDADGEDDIEVSLTKIEGKFVTIDLKQVSPLERIQEELDTEAEEEDVDEVISDGSAVDEDGNVIVDGDRAVVDSEITSETEGSRNLVPALLAVLTIAVVLGVWYWVKKSKKFKT